VTSFLIGPAFINVNYALPSISPDYDRVRIAYSEDVKALLEAILADMGLNVPPRQYTILKTSINIDANLQSLIATAGGEKLGMSQKLSDVFAEVPKREWVHVLVKPRYSGMDFIFPMSTTDLPIYFHKNWEVFTV
jgi:hypothetical protein